MSHQLNIISYQTKDHNSTMKLFHTLQAIMIVSFILQLHSITSSSYWQKRLKYEQLTFA